MRYRDGGAEPIVPVRFVPLVEDPDPMSECTRAEVALSKQASGR